MAANSTDSGDSDQTENFVEKNKFLINRFQPFKNILDRQHLETTRKACPNQTKLLLCESVVVDQ